jgi:hypothetical protein
MNVALDFAGSSLDDIKAALDGGSLTVYSVARPDTADKPVDRSAVLATFTFGSPAFGPTANDIESPSFVTASVPAATVGTPGFARARKADGTTVADFSAGPGEREIKFTEISCSPGAPVTIASFRIITEGGWPERPEYYDSRPRPGYAMPRTL